MKIKESDDLNLVDPFEGMTEENDSIGGLTGPTGEGQPAETNMLGESDLDATNPELHDPDWVPPLEEGNLDATNPELHNPDYVPPLEEGEFCEPELYEDEDDLSVVAPELGEMPTLGVSDEPVVVLDEPEDDLYEYDNLNESKEFVAVKSFHLPEERRVIVSKGDRIIPVGRTSADLPKFAESVFQRAVAKLTESRKGALVTEGKSDNVALIGNSVLVEVAKDWKLPGTNVIFEKGDVLQIVSKTPIREEKDDEEEKKDEGKGKKEGVTLTSAQFSKLTKVCEAAGVDIRKVLA